MSQADWVFAAILVLGVYLGYKRGFLMELFFLLALVAGVLVGFKLMGWGVEVLTKRFNADTTILPYISFFIIFLLVVVLVIFIGGRIKNSLDKTFLGRMDAIAGAVLGLLKYTFSLSIILWLLESFKFDWLTTWTADSKLYPLIAPVGPKVSSFFGDFLPFFKETFKHF